MKTFWRYSSHAAAMLALGMSVLVTASAAAQLPMPPRPVSGDFRIAGMMVDASDGRPLARAVVTVTLATGGDTPHSVTTGDDGKFFFEHLIAGKFRLSARRHGYAAQQYKEHESFTSAIAVGPKKDSGGIRFALRPGATISGLVTDEANEAVRAANVQLFHTDLRDGKNQTQMQTQTTTDDEGHYRFGQLQPGDYLVSVEARPWYAENNGQQFRFAMGDRFSRLGIATPVLDASTAAPDFDVIYPVNYFSNANSAAEATPIHVASGDHARADVALNPIPSLHLLVHTSGANESVVVNSGSESHFGRATNTLNSGTAGLVDVGGLAPGTVTVIVRSPGGGQVARRPQTLALSGNAEIYSDSESDGVTISGVVKSVDGSPLPTGTMIVLQSKGVQLSSVPTVMDDKGEFHFSQGGLPPGTYEPSVIQPQVVVVGMTATGATVADGKVILGAEKDVHLTVTIAKASASVAGIAVKNEQPQEGLMMLLVPQDYGGITAFYRRDQSDSDGTFTFGNVVPGRYVALAIEDGWELEWSKPEVLAKYLERGEKITVGRDGIENLKIAVQ